LKSFIRGPKNSPKIIKKILDDFFPEGLRGTKFLDAAAGNGYFTKMLLEQGAKVVAVDNDTEQWLIKSVNCIKTDLNQVLPFSDGSFDGIISIETIEHLENPYQLIREFSRILKKNGMVVISTPNTHCIRSKMKYLITGYPVLFEFSNSDIGPDEFHLQPVTIGHFLHSFKLNNIKFIDLYSISWEKNTLFTKLILYSFGCVIGYMRKFINKKHLENHYLNVLSVKQLSILDSGEQLFIVGSKKS